MLVVNNVYVYQGSGNGKKDIPQIAGASAFQGITMPKNKYLITACSQR